MGRGETGAGAALPIYISYAKKALELYPNREFPQPEGIYFDDVDGMSVPFYDGTNANSGINAIQTNENQDTRSAEDLLMQGF